MAKGFKTGGRQKGTPNKRSQAVIDKLEHLGCDPISGMAKIAEDTSNPVEVRVQCYRELAQYVAPKRRAVAVEETTPEKEATREEMVERIKELVHRNPGLLEVLAERPKTLEKDESYRKSPSISLVAHG